METRRVVPSEAGARRRSFAPGDIGEGVSSVRSERKASAPWASIGDDSSSFHKLSSQSGLVRLYLLLVFAAVCFMLLPLLHDDPRRSAIEKSFQMVSFAVSAVLVRWLLKARRDVFLRWFDAALCATAVIAPSGSFVAYAYCQAHPGECLINIEFTTFQVVLQCLFSFVMVGLGNHRFLSSFVSGLARSGIYLALVFQSSEGTLNEMLAVVVPSVIVAPLVALAQEASAVRLHSMYLGMAEAITRAESSEANRANFQRWIFHEIRVPMNSITLGVDNIAAEHPDDECAEEVRHSCARISRVLRTMLLQSQIEAGSLIVNRSWSDLDSIVKPITQRCDELARQRGLLFSWATPQLHVYADASLLIMVLRTIMGNAFKFTEQGSISIEAELDSQRQALVFTVSDTGMGISEEGQLHVFEPYVQIDPERGGKSVTSTGLQLAIAYHVIRAHGGDMWCHSELGRGSTFKFELPQPFYTSLTPAAVSNRTLPTHDAATRADVHDTSWIDRAGSSRGSSLHQSASATPKATPARRVNADPPTTESLLASPSDAPAKRWAAPPSPSQPLQQLKQQEQLDTGRTDSIMSPHPNRTDSDLRNLLRGKRVLVVEDSLPSWKMLNRFLLRFNVASCDHAANGQIAVDLCRDQAFDLVLMDKEMPVMDGVACTRALRDMGVAVPIIGLTGSALDLEVFKRSGLDAVLTKPLDKFALAEVLRAKRGVAPQVVPDLYPRRAEQSFDDTSGSSKLMFPLSSRREDASGIGWSPSANSGGSGSNARAVSKKAAAAWSPGAKQATARLATTATQAAASSSTAPSARITNEFNV